jgi:hypothetical protein
MDKKLPSTKAFAILSGLSLGIMVALSVAGSIAEPMIKAGSPLYFQLSSLMAIIFFLLFLMIAFSLTPLMVRLFFVLLPVVFSQVPSRPVFIETLIRDQDRIGNLVILTLWGVYTA